MDEKKIYDSAGRLVYDGDALDDLVLNAIGLSVRDGKLCVTYEKEEENGHTE